MALRSRLALLLTLLTSLVVACSGPEQPADQHPSPEPEASEQEPGEQAPAEQAPGEQAPAEQAPGEQAPEPGPDGTEPDDSPPCASDAECVMFTPCCDCPRVARAMHQLQAEQTRNLCMRVRCAACGEEAPPGPALQASCVDSRCVAVPEGSPPQPPRCTSDAECAVHTPCCVCPPVPQVMHVDAVENDNMRCARRSCVACDATFDGPAPTPACVEGACVAR